jgi:hypothetical protein
MVDRFRDKLTAEKLKSRLDRMLNGRNKKRSATPDRMILLDPWPAR